jgi:AraC-like DNA-binding protein
LSIGSIALAMSLSPDHVCKLFRNEPVPLSRLIWQQRLDACRRELADPRLAERGISDIAYSWGFNDAAHFSRSFREQHGMSPREWRLRELGAAGAPALRAPPLSVCR